MVSTDINIRIDKGTHARLRKEAKRHDITLKHLVAMLSFSEIPYKATPTNNN